MKTENALVSEDDEDGEVEECVGCDDDAETSDGVEGAEEDAQECEVCEEPPINPPSRPPSRSPSRSPGGVCDVVVEGEEDGSENDGDGGADFVPEAYEVDGEGVDDRDGDHAKEKLFVEPRAEGDGGAGSEGPVGPRHSLFDCSGGCAGGEGAGSCGDRAGGERFVEELTQHEQGHRPDKRFREHQGEG